MKRAEFDSHRIEGSRGVHSTGGRLGCFLVIVFACAFVGCSSGRREVEQASAKVDPALLKLERAFNEYVRRAILDDGTEVGVITFRDGSSARYWFRSHHLTGDEGFTLFRLSDGTEISLRGYFCCEVQLPEEQLGSLDDLRAFIREHNGVSP